MEEIKEMSDLYTKYTITLRDLIDREPTFLEDIFTIEFPDIKQSFIDVFRGMYDIYEIGGETIEEFKIFLTNRFKVRYPYYKELIAAYQTSIDGYGGLYQEQEVDNIDLPNKVTQAEYITSKQKTQIKGGITAIEIKRQYMDLLRNVYEDFARDFKDCFILLYS